MLVSYRWLTELLGEDPSVERAAKLLTSAGLQVENVTRVGERLRPIVVASVVSSRPHPTSKNPLTLVTVDTGGSRVEVVCGAPNVPAAGGLVCFAPVGASVLDRKGQPFTLEAKPVAGIVSVGMLCAEDELGIGTDHAGIVVLARGTAGASLLDAVPALGDSILELNVTPNRPDALGHIGVARDLAALLGLRWTPPPPPAPPARDGESDASSAASVRIDDAVGCPRYTASVLEGVRVGPSPLAMRVRLNMLGLRPINSVVDVTNYVMLLYGQPLHGFDLDVLAGQSVVVRRARNRETLMTLDGVTRELHADDLLIADRERPIAIAGVMGGEGSGITNGTTRVLIESAYFEPRGVRRSARRHGMHTDASHRFERGVDPDGVPVALAAATSMLAEISGATVRRGIIDVHPAPAVVRTIRLRTSRARSVLGMPVDDERARGVLESLAFGVSPTSRDGFDVRVPGHRPDVQREIDLIEEIGRIVGFASIPSALPPTSGARAGSKRDYALRRRAREYCTALGLDEAVNYSFISAGDIEAIRGASPTAVRIVNPLSEDRACMRPSLLPGLLRSAGHALRHGVPAVRLFEIGATFHREHPQEPGLASEKSSLAFVLAGPRDAYLAHADDVDIFDAKGATESLLETLANAVGTFVRTRPAPAWAHPNRYAWVEIETQAGARSVGAIGELHPDVRDAHGFARRVVAAEFVLDAFATDAQARRAVAPGRFPAMRRDVALLLREDTAAGDVLQTLSRAAGELCERVELFDRYVGKELPAGHHSLAFALWFRSEASTLTDELVDDRLRIASEAAAAGHGAVRR